MGVPVERFPLAGFLAEDRGAAVAPLWTPEYPGRVAQSSWRPFVALRVVRMSATFVRACGWEPDLRSGGGGRRGVQAHFVRQCVGPERRGGGGRGTMA